jgi:EAL domain-containing protein (putative c-di-GMP-specific phosphodiesterase class I)
MGIGLEIDDFGTGYSSLSYLQRLPFDTVKIDRSFIKELGVFAESSDIVRTIVELARSMRMKVVAEGVETEDQLQKLALMGCELAQGFYFAKPACAGTTLALMEERDALQRAFALLEEGGQIAAIPKSRAREQFAAKAVGHGPGSTESGASHR